MRRNNKVIQLNSEKEYGNEPRQQNRLYSIYGKCPALQIPTGQNGGGNVRVLLLYEKISSLHPHPTNSQTYKLINSETRMKKQAKTGEVNDEELTF